MYYSHPTILNSPIGNNIFVYDERKELFAKAEIVVPAMIDGTLDDIQLGDTVAFAEKIDGAVKLFTGLEKFICFAEKNIYVMDNHNHALYCWYREMLAGRIETGLSLLHIDQHSDMADPSEWIDAQRAHDLPYIAQYTNEVCTIASFIQPALKSGMIDDCVQLRTEYALTRSDILGVVDQRGYILDIDIDFWAPEMRIEEFDRTIEIVRGLIAGASMVTIATSPCFIEQKRALEIVRLLLS